MSYLKKHNVISADSIYEHILELCTLGQRVAGSSGDKEAGSYCERYFANLGLETRIGQFGIKAFTEKWSRLVVLDPLYHVLKCRPHLRSKSTPEGGIIGRVVYVGSGRQIDYKYIKSKRYGNWKDDYWTNEVEGKFVLLDHNSERQGTPHFVSLIDIAENEGALGVLMSSRFPGNIIQSMGAHRFGTPIPCVSISYEDALFLRQTATKGPTEIQLEVISEMQNEQAKNVIGLQVGKELPHESILISSHTDTTNGSPGANDNASGVAGVLELAKYFSSRKNKKTLIFAAFSGEEGGCIGSSQFLEKHCKDLGDIRAVINLDGISIGNKIWQPSEAIRYPYGHLPGKKVKPPAWLSGLVAGVFHSYGFRIEHYPDLTCFDEGPFLAAGIPATGLHTAPPSPYQHSPMDRPEYCNANLSKIVVEVVGLIVNELSNRDFRKMP